MEGHPRPGFTRGRVLPLTEQHREAPEPPEEPLSPRGGGGAEAREPRGAEGALRRGGSRRGRQGFPCGREELPEILGVP